MPNVAINNLSETWNNAGTTFTGIKLNVTDTASASGSLLLDLQKGGTSQLVLNKSGNLGLGVTPSAWGSGIAALQLKNGAAWWSISAGTGYLVQNAYYDGSAWRYTATSSAGYMRVGSTFGFFTAGSGTAGDAVSFTERAVIDTSAFVINEPGADYDFRVEGDTDANLLFVDASTDRVGIGTNAPGYKLAVAGNAEFGANGFLKLLDTGSGNGRLQITGIGSFDCGSDFLFRNNAGSVVYLDITGAGNVLLGGTTPPTTGTKSLSIFTGTAPTATAADSITVYSSDLSAGNTMLSIYTEGTPVSDIVDNPVGKKIAMRVNGSVYYVLADTDPVVNTASAVGSFTWNSATSSPAAIVNVGSRVVTQTHKGMRRCVINDSGVVQYYLSALDSTQKADGTAATLTGADGQVMVEIPKFYTKFEKSGSYYTWSVSSVDLPGFTVHPAFVKDGVEVDFRYIGAYDACVYDVTATDYIGGLNYDNNDGANGVQVDVTASTGDKLASVSGEFPMVGLTRAEFRTIAANRGTGWRQLDFTLWSAIQLLYLIEFQSFYSQNITGAGNTGTTYAASSGTQSDSGNSESGKSNSLGNGSTNTTNGASSASRGVAFMSYRGIENWYGNCWNWADGINVNVTANGNVHITNNSANFADDTASGHTLVTSTAATSSGFVSAVAAIDNYFIATSVSGGSASTFLTDQWFGSASSNRVVLVGGSATNGANAGAFSVYTLDASSAALRSFGARLAF